MPTLLLDVHLWCVLTQTGPNHPLKAIAHSPPCYRPESALPLTQDYYALGIEGRLASRSVFTKKDGKPRPCSAVPIVRRRFDTLPPDYNLNLLFSDSAVAPGIPRLPGQQAR